MPKLTVHQCKHCGHEWASRLAHLPKRCAQCRTPNWQREREFTRGGKFVVADNAEPEHAADDTFYSYEAPE